MSGVLVATTVATATACGVMSGVFHTFSTFVLRGLDDLAAPEAVRAMQGFNRHAPRALAVPLLGAAVGSAVLGARSLGRLGDTDARWQATGAALYLAAFGLTALYHVPRNNALDRLPTAPGEEANLAAAWAAYAPGWRRWNHVRTAASVGATVAFVASLT